MEFWDVHYDRLCKEEKTNTWLPVGSLYCADTTDKWTAAAFYLLSGATTKNVEDPSSL